MRWCSRIVHIGVHSCFLSPGMISVRLLMPDSAALKLLIKRQRRTYFPAAYFPRIEGFFSNGDKHLATNIVKNVVSLPLWALKKEC